MIPSTMNIQTSGKMICIATYELRDNSVTLTLFSSNGLLISSQRLRATSDSEPMKRFWRSHRMPCGNIIYITDFAIVPRIEAMIDTAEHPSIVHVQSVIQTEMILLNRECSVIITGGNSPFSIRRALTASQNSLRALLKC